MKVELPNYRLLIRNIMVLLVCCFVFYIISACSSGGGDDPKPKKTTPVQKQSISGGGVKGPLINADISVFKVDVTQTDLKASAADGSGVTDASAKLSGVALTLPLEPPYIMEVTSNAATQDITTGSSPVIPTLRTVITQEMLNFGINIYATPLTTLAVDLAVVNADSNTPPYTGNNDGQISVTEFLAALDVAAQQVVSTVGFGMTGTIDIFSTPPLFDENVTTQTEIDKTTAYRAAIESLAAVMGVVAQNAGITTEQAFNNLSNDLIDGVVDDVEISTAFSQFNPATTNIPNTNPILTPNDVKQILLDDQLTTANETTPPVDWETTPPAIEVPTSDPDLDNDGLMNVVESNTGIYVNTNDTGTDPNNPDSDGDSVNDGEDICPVVSNADQADVNQNSIGDACESIPEAAVDNISVDEGGTVTVLDSESNTVLANDSDDDNDTLSAVLDIGPSNASDFTLNGNGTFSYTHNGSETVSDSFTYHANDGVHDSNIVTVEIAINPQDDPTMLVADTNTATEDDAVNAAAGNLLDNDVDPDTALSVTNVAALNGTGDYGTLEINDTGAYSYTLDNANTDVDALNNGQSLFEEFTYEVNNGPTSTLTITIHGVTDTPPQSVDVTGVWAMNMEIVSENPSTCSDGVGSTETSLITITQTPSQTQGVGDLSAKAYNGMVLSGMINEASGVFSLQGNLQIGYADIGNPANTALIPINISATVSGTATSTSMVTASAQLTRSVNSQNQCIYSQNLISGDKIYQHSGSEDYSGVYATETLQETDRITGTVTDREITVQESVFNGSSFNSYFPWIPTGSDTISNVTFEPDTGYFSMTIDWVTKDTAENDPTTVLRSSVGHEEVHGIFIVNPEVTNGENGVPLMVSTFYAYERGYNGDVDDGGTPDYVDNKRGWDYSKRLVTTPFTRTVFQRKGNQFVEPEIRIGLSNPPLRRVHQNSQLYFEVLNGSEVLCSTPILLDGSGNGGYIEQHQMPHPNFETLQFRGSNYSRVRCNTSLAGQDRVFNGVSYTVRVLDTGPNGVNDGGGQQTDDFISYITDYAAEVVDIDNRYNDNVKVYDLNVNGARTSISMSGDVLPLYGYFDITDTNVITWPALQEPTGSYQLRLVQVGEPYEIRYGTNSVRSISIPPNTLDDETEIHMMAANDITGSGPIALTFSRKLEMIHGIRGLFNLELGNNIPFEYQTLQVYLDGDSGPGSRCDVTNNPHVSCSSWQVDFGLDVVTLNMVDVTGGLVGTNMSFTLQLHFKTTGTVNSARAVVISPDVNNISNSTAGSTASARMVNSELRVRSMRYSDGVLESYVVLANPLFVGAYDRAIFTAEDNGNFRINGFDTGVNSAYMWNGDFAANVSRFTTLPTDDGRPQRSGRYVSQRVNTNWELGVGLLGTNDYKATLSNIANSAIPNLVFRKEYVTTDPSPYVAPVLDDVIVLRPGSTNVMCSSETPLCDATSAVDVTNSASTFGVQWTVSTSPENSEWRLIFVDDVAGVQVRTNPITPGVGQEITAVDNQDGTITYTWNNPGYLRLETGQTARILVVVDDGASRRDFKITGRSADADQIYLTVPVP